MSPEAPPGPSAAPDAAVPPTPAPQTAVPPPPDIPPPPPTAAGELAENCLPGCRTGFSCVRGRCVSSCNPPCSIGDYCSLAGECVPRDLEPLPGDARIARRGYGYHRHDGFFFRVTSGFGGGAVTLDIPDEPERTYSGVGWSASVDAGASPVDDLVIFGRLRGAWVIEPELRVDDEEVETVEGLAVNQGLFGAGLHYYVMPLNLYFGGAVGFSVIETVQSRRNRDDRSDTSDVGVGIDLDVGKEWWIDDNWGIGAALRLSLSAVPADGDVSRDAVFGSGFLAVLFSATYQ